MSKRDDEKGPIATEEKVVRRAVEDYRTRAKQISKRMGTRPWDEERLSARQKLAVYAALRDDDEHWASANLVEGRTLTLSDGLVPRNFRKDAASWEQKYQAAVAAGDLPGPEELAGLEEETI
jgi:hypothetical protein